MHFIVRKFNNYLLNMPPKKNNTNAKKRAVSWWFRLCRICRLPQLFHWRCHWHDLIFVVALRVDSMPSCHRLSWIFVVVLSFASVLSFVLRCCCVSRRITIDIGSMPCCCCCHLRKDHGVLYHDLHIAIPFHHLSAVLKWLHELIVVYDGAFVCALSLWHRRVRCHSADSDVVSRLQL